MSAAANPWGLTPREAEVMDSVIETGSQKGAARALGVSLKTVEMHCWTAGHKIDSRMSRIKRYIEWDRWRQQSAGAQA